jgi:hypothetical protein
VTPDTCEGCTYLWEAATGHYACTVTDNPVHYDTSIDEAPWSDECPLGAEEGDDQ